jgi:hypothetical protein
MQTLLNTCKKYIENIQIIYRKYTDNIQKIYRILALASLAFDLFISPREARRPSI